MQGLLATSTGQVDLTELELVTDRIEVNTYIYIHTCIFTCGRKAATGHQLASAVVVLVVVVVLLAVVVVVVVVVGIESILPLRVTDYALPAT